MSQSVRATWRNPKRKRQQTGTWEFHGAGGFFYICLDSCDPVSGDPRKFRVYDDKPNFNGYMIVEETR